MAEKTDYTVQSLFNIAGWVCVVTGGGTGLGLITSNALAANGAKVYITGRRADVLKKAETQHASGGSIVALPMDVTKKDSIAAAVREISTKEKFVNLLVNNAGVSGLNYGEKGMPTGSIEEISKQMFSNQDFDGWTLMYSVNVASYYFCSAAFLPLLVAARDHGYAEAGSIVNISSMSGITKESQNGQFAYNASKAACISLTEQLATDFKRPGVEVRVNTLAPGYFPSEMTIIDESKGGKEHFMKHWGIPAGRPGRPRDYAQALLNFAVNGYVTGATLVIDGAWLLAHA
jgi:NAD(P)-dependent dehydrogenase (short-subunit alcohol dehydrogenase family)